MSYNFVEQLAFSKGRVRESDEATLKAMFPECVSVEKTTTDVDRAGVDYVVTLRRGAIIRVDAKARSKGCRQFWRNGAPEIPMEIWSVRPGGKYNTPRELSKVGWTLDESKDVDLILYTWDRADHEYAYVRSFPLLRETFRRYFSEWQTYKHDVQDSERWESECLFVPLEVADAAMYETARIRTALSDPDLLISTEGMTSIYEQDELWTRNEAT